MRFTKLPHACLRLEARGRTLVIDPGAFSNASRALADADAVLVTHEHYDHVDLDAVRVEAARGQLAVYATEGVAKQLDIADRVTVVHPGDRLDVAGFDVEVLAGDHEVIHPSMPVVSNVGYLVDQTLFHPGDSYTPPGRDVALLCLPLNAPWTDAARTLDYLGEVKPERVLPVHDALLSRQGLDVYLGYIRRFASAYGAEVVHE